MKNLLLFLSLIILFSIIVITIVFDTKADKKIVIEQSQLSEINTFNSGLQVGRAIQTEAIILYCYRNKIRVNLDSLEGITDSIKVANNLR